jgi:hypothetical protein
MKIRVGGEGRAGNEELRFRSDGGCEAGEVFRHKY